MREHSSQSVPELHQTQQCAALPLVAWIDRPEAYSVAH